jgi:hypothetical protein
MKRLTLILFAFILLCPVAVYSQSPFDGCAPEGARKKNPSNPTGSVPAKEAAMNRMKNRDKVTGSIDHSVTIQSLIAAKNETDLDETKPVQIIGYVAHVIPGTPNETCNCARGDIADIHIDVVAKKADKDNKVKYVIVEITPRFEEALGNVATVKQKIEGKCVQFTGWPTYDYKHRSNSRNIQATGNIWRATAWEVHPVTAFEVVACP